MCRTCDIIVLIHFLVRNNKRCANINKPFIQTNHFFKATQRARRFRPTQIHMSEHNKHNHIDWLHGWPCIHHQCVNILSSRLWISTWNKTIRNRRKCIVFNYHQHQTMLFDFEVTNEILSALQYFRLHVSSFIRPACPHLFFWRFYSFIPLHLISPVMTAALLSLCFHVGRVHREKCGRVGDWYWWAGGSGTAWSTEHAAPRDDRGGLW